MGSKTAIAPSGSILLTRIINATRGYSCGEDELSLKDCIDCEELEDGSIQINKGELYKTLTKEYGRCISKMYYDGADGAAIPIGWVFEKRVQYSDCKDTYLQEAWVSLATVTPRKFQHLTIA
jgi:hypothetical protein